MTEAAQQLDINLSKFHIGFYQPAPKWKVLLWYPFNYFIFNSVIPWPYTLKSSLLRLFGATVGKGLVIKMKVRIKNPWYLRIGTNCWIGESVWIDNLATVEIGNNVCISQGALLLTGNHDYTRTDFPYRLGRIKLEDGVWIGARAVVCPNVTCKSHSILTVNSVASKNLEVRSIYSGNPATFSRERHISK